ncbi:MAG: hypothetical protein HY735_38460 [Verrucomicrobia bacterium]|nr:hypothetical protein [Verrucomicrobiota bacterium]
MKSEIQNSKSKIRVRLLTSAPTAHAFVLCLLFASGCSDTIPTGSLVLTQTPAHTQQTHPGSDVLDQRYPAGSRLILAVPPFKPGSIRVLSQGLVAAGSPLVCLSGRRVCFVGKSAPDAPWQIYEADLRGGSPRAVTSIEGGAMDPAMISASEWVFSSPVPKAGQTWNAQNPPALYVQSGGQSPRRLTFGTTAAVQPTVLRDGKILFVSSHPSEGAATAPNLGLFTMNRDGTELALFALDRDGAPLVYRPRELADGRVAFLASSCLAGEAEERPESVRMARPFRSRSPLFLFPTPRCRSVESDGEGGLLACFERGSESGGTSVLLHPGPLPLGEGERSALSRTAQRERFDQAQDQLLPLPAGEGRGEGERAGLQRAVQRGGSTAGSFAVYRVDASDGALREPILDDPAWHDIEAAPLIPRTPPSGHMSTVALNKSTGTILCLNANFTRQSETNGTSQPNAARIRVLAASTQRQQTVLGEVPLHSDGSFLVEVPADTPLGFELLDKGGNVLKKLPPSIWVRPGENRSCLGCHEPPNRSPRNARPIAANFPPAVLNSGLETLAQHSPSRSGGSAK